MEGRQHHSMLLCRQLERGVLPDIDDTPDNVQQSGDVRVQPGRYTIPRWSAAPHSNPIYNVFYTLLSIYQGAAAGGHFAKTVRSIIVIVGFLACTKTAVMSSSNVRVILLTFHNYFRILPRICPSCFTIFLSQITMELYLAVMVIEKLSNSVGSSGSDG